MPREYYKKEQWEAQETSHACIAWKSLEEFCSPEQVEIGQEHTQQQENEAEFHNELGYERQLKEFGFVIGGDRRMDRIGRKVKREDFFCYRHFCPIPHPHYFLQ